MARMYPNQLSDNVQSEAERVLYEKFRDDLDNSYVVFHGVTWQALNSDGRPRDGEADFIIAHPDRGVMVLEVKGGVIRCDPRRDYWTSEDKNGRIHTIKDPFYQARNSKYVLLDSLNAMLNMPYRRINIVDAVAFPDVDIVAQLPGLNKPREIVLDRGDLLNVSAWVGQCFAYGRGSDSQRDTAPGSEAVTALMNLLGKTWELRPVLWGDFRHEERQLIQLTQQQYTILDVLNRQRQVLISGCAGSGKTMLAIEKARRLAQQKFRVLFVCYNKSLARDLKRKLAQTEYLRIAHYHGLCYEMADQAGRMPTKPQDFQAQKRFFDQELPEALMDAADRLQHVRYDAIIVDEGQDFLEDWWIPLQTLLRDPDSGILYIFFDDNQRIYQRLNAFPIQSEPYVLSTNCRNTQSIHKKVVKFYRGDGSTLPTVKGPLGRPVEIVKIRASSQMVTTVHEICRHLMIEEKIPSDEIVVLSPVRQKSQLSGKYSSDVPLTNTWPPPAGQVFATTIHDFKGMESAVVILVEAELWPSGWADLEPLLYVACSRARHHLLIVLPENAPAKLQGLFT